MINRGIIVKKPRKVDTSKYNFAYSNVSAAHTYGNVMAVMTNYIKSLFGDNYFNYIHVATKIAYKEFDFRKNTKKEVFKKEKPMIIIRPRIVLDDGDLFMSNTPLTKRLTDNFFIKNKGDLMPFFEDMDRGIIIKYGLNRMCMEFDVMIVTETVMEQINLVNSFRNRVRQGMDFTLETALESCIPQKIIDLVSNDSRLPVYDENGKVKRFLDYMNCYSGFPVTYKLKGSSKRDEFFRYYNAKLDTRISNLQIDEGSKKGMTSDNATITFNVRTEFWGTGLYYYFTLEKIKGNIDDTQDDNVYYPLFSTDIFKNMGLPEGYEQYTSAMFKTDELKHGLEDSIQISTMLNDNLEQLVKYCVDTSTPIEPFMKIIITDNGRVIEEDEFSYDLKTNTVTIKKSNKESTYRMMVYVNNLFLNNYISDIINSDLDTHKISVDSSLKNNQYDVTLPPHYKIQDNAVIDKTGELITDIPNYKPLESDKDFTIYIGKIKSAVPNSYFLNRDYTTMTAKANQNIINISVSDINNQYTVICLPEEFMNVKRIYLLDDPFKNNIRKEFNVGYIKLNGLPYKFYVLGRDTISKLDLVFEM